MSRAKPLVSNNNLTKLMPLRFTPADHARVIDAAQACGYRYATEYCRAVVIAMLNARDADAPAPKRKGIKK